MNREPHRSSEYTAFVSMRGYIWDLWALQEMRRFSPVVVWTAGQVNAGPQQVNLSRAGAGCYSHAEATPNRRRSKLERNRSYRVLLPPGC
jgi:hypothetical protein